MYIALIIFHYWNLELMILIVAKDSSNQVHSNTPFEPPGSSSCQPLPLFSRPIWCARWGLLLGNFKETIEEVIEFLYITCCSLSPWMTQAGKSLIVYDIWTNMRVFWNPVRTWIPLSNNQVTLSKIRENISFDCNQMNFNLPEILFEVFW